MVRDNNDVLLAVGELKGAAEAVQKSLDRFSGVLDKHDTRISKVEERQSRFAGVATALGAVGGYLLSVIAKKIGVSG